jgi:hypothetical protein
VEDYEIVQADETIEIADPWFNTCPGGGYKKWVAQVMWLVDDSSDYFAEVGWRRECNGSSARDYAYYAEGRIINNVGYGNPRVFVDSNWNPVSVSPGERIRVRIMKEGPGEYAQNLWRFQLEKGGSVYEPKAVSISTSFLPKEIHVGGENLYDHHDMGVSGHLETTYKLSNGTQLFLYDRSVSTKQDYPRYRIVKGSGGFGNSRYFQTHSNIHVNSPSPTQVPPGTSACP